MFRLFKKMRRKETKIMATFHYHTDIIDINRRVSKNFEYRSLYSKQDFNDLYDIIELEINKVQHSNSLNLVVEIKLSGKLNGRDMTEEFNDLSAYHQFLANHSLIDTRKSIKRTSK